MTEAGPPVLGGGCLCRQGLKKGLEEAQCVGPDRQLHVRQRRLRRRHEHRQERGEHAAAFRVGAQCPQQPQRSPASRPLRV